MMLTRRSSKSSAGAAFWMPRLQRRPVRQCRQACDSDIGTIAVVAQRTHTWDTQHSLQFAFPSLLCAMLTNEKLLHFLRDKAWTALFAAFAGNIFSLACQDKPSHAKTSPGQKPATFLNRTRDIGTVRRKPACQEITERILTAR